MSHHRFFEQAYHGKNRACDNFSRENYYDPFYIKYKNNFRNNSKKHLIGKHEILFQEFPTAKGFRHVLTEQDVVRHLTNIPNIYLHNLTGVVLMGGTPKQHSKSMFTFGIYSPRIRTIFLFAFPEDSRLYYKKRLSPAFASDYTQHGATWQKHKAKWVLQFSSEGLYSFYLKDVLTHELGHHVDYITGLYRSRNGIKGEEYFAEWFARIYGIQPEKQKLYTSEISLIQEKIKDRIKQNE